MWRRRCSTARCRTSPTSSSASAARRARSRGSPTPTWSPSSTPGNDEDGHPYIVFEYVDGETLKQRIDRYGRLPLDEAAAYAIEVGRGLQSAHLAHMVHRDVKPQNVLIDSEGRAKVTDFGIALSLEADGLTKTGRVLGTTDYVSPEQAMGKAVDDRSDIYSLGILLYEMLRGDVPFKAETLVGVAMKHVNDPMPDIQSSRPGTSSALAAVIERATQKDPKNRYRDMGAMLADLEGALEVEIARAGGATGEATTVLESVPSRSRILSSRSVSIVGILLVLAGVLVALALVELGGESDRPNSEVAGEETEAPASGAEIPLSDPTDFDPVGTATASIPRRSTSRSTATRPRSGSPSPTAPVPRSRRPASPASG